MNQSFRGAQDIETAKQAILQRLAVLSSAQDILVAGSTDGTPLGELIGKALALAEERGRASRIRIEGPHLHVGPRAATSIALIVHELLTNALKYGALSRDEGAISVAWRHSTLEGAPALELVWTESEGPAVVPPTQSGFGSRLVRSGITGAKSTVELDFAPEGLQCRIVADLKGVQSD